MQGVWVRSLVGKLESYMPCGTAKKIKINKIHTYSRPPSLFFLLWAVPRTPESSMKKETKGYGGKKAGVGTEIPLLPNVGRGVTAATTLV